MEHTKKPSDADLVAEMNHFRTETIQRDIETGSRKASPADPLVSELPAGVQASRPTLSKDAPMNDPDHEKKPAEDLKPAAKQPSADIAPQETEPSSLTERKPGDYPDLGGEID